MSERGIIVTAPIYHDAARDLVEKLFSAAGPTTRVGKAGLSLVCAAGGLYSGEERVTAREMADELAQQLPSIDVSIPPAPIRIFAIPDTAGPVLLEIFYDGRVVETEIAGEWVWK